MTTENVETNNVIDTEMGDLEDFPDFEDTSLPLVEVKKMFEERDVILKDLVTTLAELKRPADLRTSRCRLYHRPRKVIRKLLIIPMSPHLNNALLLNNDLTQP